MTPRHPGTEPVPPLPAEPMYLPFQAGPHRASMGLVSQPLDALTAFDRQYHMQMAMRRDLLDTRHDEVFAARQSSAAMRAEALDVLVAHLLADRAGWFSRSGRTVVNRLTDEQWHVDAPPCDPLELAGRLVQEDLCLLAPEPGLPLVAAVLCFPSRWRLADKIGQPLAAIHGPVPLYAERLATPVERFIEKLRSGRLVERFNWSIHDDPALFQPHAHGEDTHGAITADDAGTRLTLRIERQTLSRLPATGAVLFTIHTHQQSLARIAAIPGAAAELRTTVANLPPDVADYKGVTRFAAALDEFLVRQIEATA
ncbi:DUF3445 domain-containing protein [Acidiphilium sp. PA]|uniref:heme-dependent oxidative N-demethylase family protein n=1 Tax=Acidiphilium sp. PA TaxID=2871705 RepID=UPI00224403BA|nr:DUF3445 domain-containing protein [Acidiphilium sp. PA]MCW8305852.1 DUF3445 domain-containing protein [Acidiphilium sp. PA]